MLYLKAMPKLYKKALHFCDTFGDGFFERSHSISFSEKKRKTAHNPDSPKNLHFNAAHKFISQFGTTESHY
jgi:hypothetical protein